MLSLSQQIDMRGMTLLMITTILLVPLAGCVDGGDGPQFELSPEDIEGLIDANLDDFLNNTSITIVNNNENNYTTDNSTTVNQDITTIYRHYGTVGYTSTYDKGTFQNVGGGTSTWVGTPANWINITTIYQAENTSTTVFNVDFIALVNLTNCEDTHSQENFCQNRDSDFIIMSGLQSGSPYTAIQPDTRIQVNCFETTYNSSQGFVGMMPFPGWGCEYTLQWKADYSVDKLWWNFLVERDSLLASE